MTESLEERKMSEEHAVPAAELSDEELERQGIRAHATRNWVFFHGTSEQFNTHTDRMLELEQEYLRRHPQRTWQGSGGAGSVAEKAIARDTRIRELIRSFTTQALSLLDDSPSAPSPQSHEEDLRTATISLLEAFAAAPNGSMHKLEAHQIAREYAPDARLVASLYRHDPPLLNVEGETRMITDAGRAWLEVNRTP
jgi:Family of unknown function (DUF6158)